MKQQNSKIFIAAFFIIAIPASFSFAQHDHGSHSSHSDNKQKMEKVEELPSGLSEMELPKTQEIKKDSTKPDHKMTDMKEHEKMSADTTKEQIIWEGEIDLKAIDKNNDGKVFQDQMDWNVISDKPGECPKCGMELKEVTLEKAKQNLIKHDFKVKE